MVIIIEFFDFSDKVEVSAIISLLKIDSALFLQHKKQEEPPESISKGQTKKSARILFFLI